MKRSATTLLALLLAASSAHAALRVPQVPVAGPSLQSYFGSVGETINVLTDQENVQRWSSTVSGNTSFTIQLELSANGAANTIGLYNASLAAPPLYQVFPGAATTGWFASASFRTGPQRVIVTLFDPNAVIQGQTVYIGADANDFGFYLLGPAGLFFTQDVRNPGALPHALAFKATGANSGNWWLAFEDGGPVAPAIAPPGEPDFDDCVLFMESVNPTPVSATSWGALKQRFR